MSPSTKSRTTRSRARRGAAALLLAVVATGCRAPLARLRGDVADHPADVVGEWVDVRKSTPGDTSVWVLGADGDDRTLHIRRQAGDTAAHLAWQQWGYWHGRVNEDGTRALCFDRRPGRNPWTCLAFRLDVDSTGPAPRRRLTIAQYPGAHHTGERVLVARQ